MSKSGTRPHPTIAAVAGSGPAWAGFAATAALALPFLGCATPAADPPLPSVPVPPFETPLHESARLGEGAMLAARLEGQLPVDVPDGLGNTPLHVAHDAGIVGMLVHAGAELEAVNAMGQTPLISAIMGYRMGAAWALLDAGASPNAADREGRRPLHWIALLSGPERDSGLLGVLDALLEAGARKTARDNEENEPIDYVKHPGLVYWRLR